MPRRFEPEDGDGFTEVRRPGKKHAKTYSEDDIKRFSQVFRDYFYGLTGHQLKTFKLTQSTHKYVSMLEFARGRDRVLATLFERRPVIWDLMAGSGADGLAFLLDLDPRELVLCQRSVPDQERDRGLYDASLHEYKVMCDNVKDFLRAVPDVNASLHVDGESPGSETKRTLIKCKHALAEDFIMSNKVGTEVDCVYLDPSWDDDHDAGGDSMRGQEMTPSQLFERLDRLIWQPMKIKNIKVGCYVIKTRWNWLKVQQYMAATGSEFEAMYSVRTQPFRPNVENMRPGPNGEVQGVYHYMILTHREYKTINMKNSQMYWDIVRNNVPVWVKRSTCVGVAKPVYSDHAQFPDVTHDDPHNAGYFEVKPHKRERQQKAEGGQKPEEERSYHSQQFEHVPSAGGAGEPDEEPPADRNRFYHLPSDA